MKIKNSEIIPLYRAHAELLQAKDGKALFQFPATVTWNLVKNFNLLKTEVNLLEESRLHLIGGRTLEAGSEAEKEFVASFQKILDEERELALATFTQASFDLDRNAIPGTTLIATLCLIKD